MWENMLRLEGVLLQSLSPTEGPWRTDAKFFHPQSIVCGCINISPTWFQQGRHVWSYSSLLYISSWPILAIGWTVQARNVCPPETEPARYGMRGWLVATREQASILSSAVAIMHLEIYCTGREALVCLRQWAAWENRPNICEVLTVWPSIYNVASIMVNQANPIHANHFGRPQWMDLLVTFSNYTDLHFIIPSIHSRFLYEPGTVIALSGQLLSHGVGHTNGDHGVISYCMRDNVHEFVNIPWCNYMEYCKVLNTFWSYVQPELDIPARPIPNVYCVYPSVGKLTNYIWVMNIHQTDDWSHLSSGRPSDVMRSLRVFHESCMLPLFSSIAR